MEKATDGFELIGNSRIDRNMETGHRERKEKHSFADDDDANRSYGAMLTARKEVKISLSYVCVYVYVCVADELRRGVNTQMCGRLYVGEMVMIMKWAERGGVLWGLEVCFIEEMHDCVCI